MTNAIYYIYDMLYDVLCCVDLCYMLCELRGMHCVNDASIASLHYV